MQSQVRYDSDTGNYSNTLFTSNYKYDAFGRLTSATINDGRPRTVTWTNGVDGQAIRRDEADNNYSNGDPHEVFYRFGGKQLGMIGNNPVLSDCLAVSRRGHRQRRLRQLHRAAHRHAGHRREAAWCCRSISLSAGT